MTISYNSKKNKRNNRGRKCWSLETSNNINVARGQLARGQLVEGSVWLKFLNESGESTTWYKGTLLLSYSRRGYVVIFDSFGPAENEAVDVGS